MALVLCYCWLLSYRSCRLFAIFVMNNFLLKASANELVWNHNVYGARWQERYFEGTRIGQGSCREY